MYNDKQKSNDIFIQRQTVQQQKELVSLAENNAKQIIEYLNNDIPHNTAILVTNRKRNNLDQEKSIELEGLTEDDSDKLFGKLAMDEQIKEASSQQQIRLKINGMIKKIGGHPYHLKFLLEA